MTRLEYNSKTIDVLWQLKKAYKRGDFSEFVNLLSEDCVYESMWVSTPLLGKSAVSTHLLGKGKSIQNSGAFPACWVVELVGSMNPLPKADVIVNGEKKHAAIALAYQPGKYCLMMEQTLNGETNGVLVDIKLTEEGLVNQINLCFPDLFQTRSLTPYVNLFPSNTGDINDAGEDDEHEAMVYVSEPYFKELYTFFCVVGEEFDEYEDFSIPMEQWKKILSSWETFVVADDYDIITEKLCGIDYATWSVANPAAHKQLNRCGKFLWYDRNANSGMLYDLKEWTEKYQSNYDFIRIYGY